MFYLVDAFVRFYVHTMWIDGKICFGICIENWIGDRVCDFFGITKIVYVLM